MKDKSLYEILQVPVDATTAEIKKAYFSLVRKYPPDRYPQEFMRIREAYETLSDEDARREYDSIAFMPPEVKVRFDMGRAALGEGDYEEAIDLLEQAALAAPGSRIIRGFLGRAYLENGNTVKAIDIFSELTGEEKDNAAYRGYLARAYLERGWHKKALDAFIKALSLDEDNISLWVGLAESYMLGDRFEDARDTLVRALEKGKSTEWDNIGIYLFLVQIEMVLGNLDNMEKYLEDLTRLAVRDETITENVGWALGGMARTLVRKGYMGIAQSIIERAVKLIPGSEAIRELKEELDRFIRLDAQLAGLQQDETMPEEIVHLIELELFPLPVIGSPVDRELQIFMSESIIIEEAHRFITCINRLRRNYPELYDLRKAFFDGVLNPAKRKKLAQRYRKKSNRYGPIIEAMMLSGMGEDQEDFIDDEDGDFIFEGPQQPYVRETPKIGRNEPCPCGSGKKYKKCCGR
ncbi:MAG: Protein export cytoplasm protein SecA ATPase RNA helicase [Firmicutes bacterium]|nr:Protein export cytoplasm protein SecA ATPase RNA helicase [Bacillota bacterium]